MDPRFNTEPATEEQLNKLRRFGINHICGIGQEDANRMIQNHEATERQLNCLNKFGMTPEGPVGRLAAWRIISQQVIHRRRLAPTPKQEAFLRKRGEWRDGMTRGEAFDRIKEILPPRGREDYTFTA